jgi:two-component sensor histidine kinase
MFKFNCILICFLLSAANGFSQTASLPDAYGKLLNARTTTEKVTALLQLGSDHLHASYLRSNTGSLDSADLYVRKALSLSQSSLYQKGSGDACVILSEIYKFKNNAAQACIYAQKAIDIFQRSGDKDDLARSYMTLMRAGEDSLEIEQSLQIAAKALSLYKETGNKKEEATTLKDIAYWHMNIGKMQQAKEELKNCLKIYNSIGFEEVQTIYSLLGVAENELGNYKESLEYHLTAVKTVERFNDQSSDAAEIYNYLAITYSRIKDVGKSNAYFEKAYRISKMYKNDGLTIMILTNLVQTSIDLKKNREAISYLTEMEKNSGSLDDVAKTMIIERAMKVYVQLKDYKSAERYVKKAVQKVEDPHTDISALFMLYPGISRYYFETGGYDLSRKYINEYKAISEQSKNLSALKDIHRTLFNLDSAQGDLKSALREYKLERAYNDSLFSEAKNKQIAELDIKYNTEEKDKDILLKDNQNRLLQKQGELQKSELSKANLIKNISFGSLLLLLIIITLIFIRYRDKQKANKLLSLQKTEISQKNATLNKLVTEKDWLLKEVHHRVKNNLQMVMSLLNAQSFYLKDDAAMLAIRESHHRIHAMSLIHKKLYQLDNVTAIDMNNYIEELVEYFRETFNTGQRIQFDLHVEHTELETSQAVPLGLILNEAITNSIKHGFPENGKGIIDITLKRIDKNKLRLVIKDNGKGSSTDLLSTDFQSLGMKLIKGLSNDLEADLQVQSQNGLTISIEFLSNEKRFEVYAEGIQTLNDPDEKQ